jgi:hypothetical protein
VLILRCRRSSLRMRLLVDHGDDQMRERTNTNVEGKVIFSARISREERRILLELRTGPSQLELGDGDWEAIGGVLWRPTIVRDTMSNKTPATAPVGPSSRKLNIANPG